MRRLVVLAFVVAACGGGSPKTTSEPTEPTKPTTPVDTARLELAEITISEGTQGLHVHKDGSVEVVDGDVRKPLGTLTAAGKFTLPDGVSAQLQDDGSMISADGPAPFRLEDETLVVGETRLTIDANNVIQGGTADLSSVKITGVTNRGTRRTALLMIGFLTLAK